MTAPFAATTPTILVQGAPAPPGAPPAGPGTDGPQSPPFLQSMMPFLLIGLVLWFLIFAPEKKARKQRQEMLDALKKGDKVVTTSGLHAEVAELRESDVVLKAGDSRFVYTRSAVAEVRSAKED